MGKVVTINKVDANSIEYLEELLEKIKKGEKVDFINIMSNNKKELDYVFSNKNLTPYEVIGILESVKINIFCNHIEQDDID